MPIGTIVSQDKSGTVDVGSVIIVQVSKGAEPTPITIPVFTSESQAISWASTNGFTIGMTTRSYSNDYSVGIIYDQSPVASSSHIQGSVYISFTVSLGKPEVPDFFGQSLASANSSISSLNIHGANLTITVSSEEFSDSIESGKIISQSVTGETSTGTVVSVVVSKGAQPEGDGGEE